VLGFELSESEDALALVFAERYSDALRYTSGRCAQASPRQQRFSPGTPYPLWAAFLAKVLAGDSEMQSFLQRYIGYCLTGRTDEHCFLFLYGTGANGKSTFINTIARVFGDYCTNASMDTFLASNQPQHPTDLAKLHIRVIRTKRENPS
jgi:P4 family phage/plasmid primase-like protien